MAASDGTNSLKINDYLQSQPLKTADLHHEFGFIEKGRRSENLWHEIALNRFFINFPITCLDRVSFQLGKDYYKKHRIKDNYNGCNKDKRLLAAISYSTPAPEN